MWEQIALPYFAHRYRAATILQLGGFLSFAAPVPQIAIWQNAHIWSNQTAGHSQWTRAYILIQRVMMSLAVSRSARNVFLSCDSRERSALRMAMDEASTEVIPIGPEACFLTHGESLGRRQRKERILTVGDIYPHKRFEILIEALPIVLRVRPKVDLAIAGNPVDRQYMDYLYRLSKDLGVADRVSFLGSVPRDSLIELYDSAAVFVSASRLETFGLTPIEAMARGLPVIATRESATPEICGEAALYFDGSCTGLAEAISGLLIDESLWTQTQQSGRQHAQMYSWESIAKRYVELIETSVGLEHREH